MQKLTQKEEQIMQVIWRMEKAFVKEVVEALPEPKPHYNTVSTVIRILEDKGFLGHQSFGNTHQYYALVQKEAYQKKALGEVLKNYFEDSHLNMVAYFAQEEKISEDELQEIIQMIKNKKQ